MRICVHMHVYTYNVYVHSNYCKLVVIESCDLNVHVVSFISKHKLVVHIGPYTCPYLGITIYVAQLEKERHLD